MKLPVSIGVKKVKKLWISHNIFKASKMFMIPKFSKAVATAGRRFAAPAAFARCFSQITVGKLV